MLVYAWTVVFEHCVLSILREEGEGGALNDFQDNMHIEFCCIISSGEYTVLGLCCPGASKESISPNVPLRMPHRTPVLPLLFTLRVWLFALLSVCLSVSLSLSIYVYIYIYIVLGVPVRRCPDIYGENALIETTT